MASRKAEDLHLELKAIWDFSSKEYKRIYPDDPQPFLTCTYRDNTEQSELYAQGRTTGKLGRIVTNAKAGQSPHNYLPAPAFDVAFKKGTTLDWTSKLFERFNSIIQRQFPGKVTWGGTFKSVPADGPHFELTNWKTLIKKK